MDLFPILLTAGLVILAAVMSFVAGAPPLMSEDSERAIAQYGRVLRGFVIGVAVFVISAGFLAATRPNVDRLDAAFFVIFPLVIGVCLTREVLLTRFEFDSDTLVATTAFKKERSVSWSNIEDITYLAWSAQYVLHFKDGVKIRVSEYLNGGDVLLDFARRWNTYNNGI